MFYYYYYFFFLAGYYNTNSSSHHPRSPSASKISYQFIVSSSKISKCKQSKRTQPSILPPSTVTRRTCQVRRALLTIKFFLFLYQKTKIIICWKFCYRLWYESEFVFEGLSYIESLQNLFRVYKVTQLPENNLGQITIISL